jgi:hypothetical protein
MENNTPAQSVQNQQVWDQQPWDQQLQAEQFYYANLPLAVYRELAAHLRQVDGVEAELLPQASQTFDYQESQVGGVKLSYQPEANTAARQRVQQILDYYSQRYGNR